MKIIQNSLSNNDGSIFDIKEMQQNLLTLVQEVCPKLPKTKKVKSKKI